MASDPVAEALRVVAKRQRAVGKVEMNAGDAMEGVAGMGQMWRGAVKQVVADILEQVAAEIDNAERAAREGRDGG